jgi:hypothetical protein
MKSVQRKHFVVCPETGRYMVAEEGCKTKILEAVTVFDSGKEDSVAVSPEYMYDPENPWLKIPLSEEERNELGLEIKEYLFHLRKGVETSEYYF